jgi:hypothetical protein
VSRKPRTVGLTILLVSLLAFAGVASAALYRGRGVQDRRLEVLLRLRGNTLEYRFSNLQDDCGGARIYGPLWRHVGYRPATGKFERRIGNTGGPYFFLIKGRIRGDVATGYIVNRTHSYYETCTAEERFRANRVRAG